MNWESLIFFGDSLTVGARTYLGYPELTGNQLQEKLLKEWNVVNHSTNGFTTIDLARSINANYSSLLEAKALLSMILIGTNDAKNNTSKEHYRIALEQVIIKTKLLTINKNVLLLIIPEFLNGVSYPYTVEMNVRIKEYNNVIVELAKKHSLSILKIEMKEEHFFDGVHFNNDGNTFFSNKISEFILRQRGI